MDTIGTILEIVDFFKMTLPYLFLGITIANLLKATRYFNLLGLPMSRITRLANLPAECSPAFSMYLLNYLSGAGMLAEYYRDKTLTGRHIIVAIMISYFPRSLNSILLFFGPLALSLFGLRTGGLILCIELLFGFTLMTAGIIAGRKWCTPESAAIIPNDGQSYESYKLNSGNWKDKLFKCMKDSIREFLKDVKILVPISIIIIVLLNIGIQEYSADLLSPFLSLFHLPVECIAVFAASLVSQTAAVAATGTIMAKVGLPLVQCLLIYAISRAIHLGTGCIRSSLPTNVALFGRSLGLKVSLIQFVTIQGTLAVIIGVLFLLQG